MKNNDISIYIHIPFCVRKCLYCDFNSQVPASEDAFFYYTDALIKEISSSREYLTDRKLASIYIGGGTPSVIPSMCIDRVLDCISDIISIEDDTEITIESNPGTVTEYKIKDYVKIGINRVSIGAQSMIEDELRALGRIHTAKDFLEAYDKFYWGGIDNISVDVMTGIPYQTRESLIKTLEEVIRLHPKHISAYSLIVENGTPFYEKLMYGTLPLPTEDEAYIIYKLTQQYLAQNGYKRYEISNYALGTKSGSSKDKDYRCRHNLRYWERGDYIGFGVSSASLIGNHRFTNTAELSEYVSAPGAVKTEDMTLSDKDAMAEFMFLGLRKTDGVKISDFKESFDTDIADIYGEVMKKHIKDGLAEFIAGEEGEEDGRFMLTERGMDVANYVMSDYML